MKKFEWHINVILAMALAEGACLFFYWFLAWVENVTTAIVVTSVLLVLFSVIAYRFVLGFTRPWGKVVFAIKRLADGDYTFRTKPTEDRFGLLVPYINELADKLEKSKHTLEHQKDQLNTLVENLGSPLVFIDKNGKIIHTNDLFIQTFHIRHLFAQDFNDLMPYEEIKQIVAETFQTQQTVRRQIVLNFSIERRHFDVYSAPILHGSGKIRGVVAVFHDITELKKLEKMRQDFVANVSHELKTPVTSIKGFAETLLEVGGQDELQEKFLQIIATESDRLQNLINDLLELSKIEQVGFRLDWKSVDLRKILEETKLVLSEKAQKKDIHINISLSGDTVVEADPYRVKQIMMNVMSNALDYSPQGSRVFVSLCEKEDRVLFTVADNGIGIAEEEIPRIFERFYRIDKARSRESGGTGLGLAIVKHLAEALHATIQVKSKKGQGTTFEISFLKRINEGN